MPDKYQLTPVELEIMEILWRIQGGTVHDVLDRLPKARQLAYTSVSTMLRILQQKKIVTIKKDGRQHIYLPSLSKEVYANHSLKKITQQAFSGKSSDLVAYLVDRNTLSIDEINHLQKILDNKKKELA